MENYNEKFSKDLRDKIHEDAHRGSLESRSGRVLGGLIVVTVGGILLARQVGVDIPAWLVSWPMFLLGLGLFIGVRQSFRGFFWLVPLLIGATLLIERIYPETSFREYIWPMLIIFFGLLMIFRPKHRSRPGRWGGDSPWRNPDVASEDEIDTTSIFGGTKKNIINKDFKGGDITTFFGGTDLNFMQADINGTATIDVTQVFGGTKLLVPPHWNIKSEVVCMFGSVEDKRPLAKESPDPNKTLMLRGTCIFGGIDIKSY